jgi:predicted ATP-binding protein involved in virulence
MENFRIESLEIDKIGAFEHIKMDFPKKTDPDKAEIHILTGENGTGKSTVLEYISQTGSMDMNISFLKKKIWDSSSYGEIKFSNNTKSILDFDCVVNSHFFGKYSTKMVEYANKIHKPESNIFDFIFVAYSGHRSFKDYKISGIDENLDNPMLNALSFLNSINPKTVLQWLANTKSKEYISKGKGDFSKSVLYAQKITDIEKIISEIICTVNEENVKIELEEDKFQIQLKIRNQYLSFDQLPDGVKSLFGWVADLVIRLHRLQWKDDLPIFDRNFILFLDEIEVHLHPAWQRKILPVVQKLFKNAQIFISTHSPFVVGSVDGAWVHKLKKDGAYAVLDGEPVLSEDAESYDTILEEIFGIKERFGVRVEEDLKKFYHFKSKILNDEDYDMDTFLNLVSKLATESIELESMLGMELKQIKRLTGKDFLATV